MSKDLPSGAQLIVARYLTSQRMPSFQTPLPYISLATCQQLCQNGFAKYRNVVTAGSLISSEPSLYPLFQVEVFALECIA
jgi:hypothetical protein